MLLSIRSASSARFTRPAVLTMIAATALLMPFGTNAWSTTVHHLIDVEACTPIYAGNDLPVAVTLDNPGPAPVTVYSDPPGAANFDGTITGTSATLPVKTDPTLDSSEVATVTIYVQSDGGVASTEVPVAY